MKQNNAIGNVLGIRGEVSDWVNMFFWGNIVGLEEKGKIVGIQNISFDASDNTIYYDKAVDLASEYILGISDKNGFSYFSFGMDPADNVKYFLFSGDSRSMHQGVSGRMMRSDMKNIDLLSKFPEIASIYGKDLSQDVESHYNTMITNLKNIDDEIVLKQIEYLNDEIPTKLHLPEANAEIRGGFDVKHLYNDKKEEIFSHKFLPF